MTANSVFPFHALGEFVRVIRTEPERIQETLWNIVRQVAERESIFFEQDASIEQWQCPFCNSGQTFHAHVRKEPFIHSNTCIVSKARALMEWRKAQPEVPLD